MSLGLLVASPETIYSKTPMGRAALEDRQAGLRVKHRQVLIMLDGARSVGALAAMMVGLELDPILSDLHTHGFIEPVQSDDHINAHSQTVNYSRAPVAQVLQAAPKVTIPNIDPLLITRAKLLMQETARSYLGLMADKLLREISDIQSVDQLRAAIAHWNMALRESRRGSDNANAHLLEVRSILGW